MSSSTIETERMHCMEVWGGNSAVHRGFEMPGLKAWVYSCPYRQAEGGGDVYYASSCASGRITRMLLADVSGHGDAVAKVARGLRDLMRRNVNFVSQRRFVRAMNKQFSKQRDESIFATALVCSFFAPTSTLQFYNAGHPAPVLFRALEKKWDSAQELASETTADGLADTPLGVIREADYSRFETKLAPGDMVLCFSDAFTESLDAEGNMLGSSGLMRFVEQVETSEQSEVIPQLVKLVKELDPNNLTEDDATILHFCADGSNPSISDNVLAPFRLLGRVHDATKIC